MSVSMRMYSEGAIWQVLEMVSGSMGPFDHHASVTLKNEPGLITWAKAATSDDRWRDFSMLSDENPSDPINFTARIVGYNVKPWEPLTLHLLRKASLLERQAWRDHIAAGDA